MKICKKCGKENEEKNFNKWYKKSGSSGLRNSCKECDHKINKNYREKNKKELSEKRKKRNKPRVKFSEHELKKRRAKQTQENNKKFPEKWAARQYLRSMVYSGKIIKPKICENCNLEKKLEGHHEDYMKPLEVIWLCKKCHTNVHFGQ